MKKNTVYLGRFSNIIEQISKDHDLSEDKVRELIDEFFMTMKRCITDPRLPTIKITNLGTFKPSIGKINWQIRTSIYRIRHGEPPFDRYRKKISQLWKVKQRLIKERLGISTWREWRNKQIDI